VFGVLVILGMVPVLIGAGAFLLGAGLRAGSRPGDAGVTAVACVIAQPDGSWPAVLATVRNPGAAPVLVGLCVRRRRLPGWVAGGMNVAVPWRTTRRRFRADRQTLSGVVGAGDTAQWTVPWPRNARRVRLVAVIGQADRRLRVLALPVGTPLQRRPAPRRPELSGRDI
jgi:hypothetical protein